MPNGVFQVKHEEFYPLVVIGGGLAGVNAALAAARQGVRVALLQDRPVLGGNSSSEIRVHPVGASQHGYHRDARETGIIEELFLEVRARSYGLRQVNGRHYPMWDVILGEKVEAEPRIALFLNTRVVGVETAAATEGGYANRITGVLALQTSTEKTFRFGADMFIDATGDGTLAVQAGAPFRYGREARAEFGEPSAPEEADDLVLGSTILFAARDVGRPAPFAPPSWASVFPDEESLPFRNHEQFESGYWWLEWGGRLNTVEDNETIRRQLHSAIFGVWDHIKNRCTVPGVRERAANWVLDWIGQTPGKRESRRFEGDTLLTEHDVRRGLDGVPPDVVAYGGWAIDLHPPDGVYSPDLPCHNPPLQGPYGIPLRSLYSRSVQNLFLAGRNISVTHTAFGSTRVMKTCAVVGQASGTAAALAVERGLSPRALAGQPQAVQDVQQTLLHDGAYLPLVANCDPCDLARQPGVVVTATSQATLRLDEDDLANPSGWEHAGMSLAETAGRKDSDSEALRGEPTGQESRPTPEWVELTTTVGQALVLSTGRLERVTLTLRSQNAEPVTARLRVRPAERLRDFGPRDGGADGETPLTALVPPGGSQVVFMPDAHIAVAPNTPVVLTLEPLAGVGWRLSAQEPPGTQAGAWDTDLDGWRWLHGTLYTEVTPASQPYGPEQVVSGVTRPEVGANLWISDPARPLPQILTLSWPALVTLRQVELTFDSQLSGWIWEGAFPLLARDYHVELLDADGATWTTVAQVEGNYQRRRAHPFAPTTARAARVTVTATNGGQTARIVEVRAY